MPFYIKNTDVHLIHQAKTIASPGHNIWSPHRNVVYNTKHYWKEGADALVAVESMPTHGDTTMPFYSETTKLKRKNGNEKRIEKEKMPQRFC